MRRLSRELSIAVALLTAGCHRSAEPNAADHVPTASTLSPHEIQPEKAAGLVEADEAAPQSSLPMLAPAAAPGSSPQRVDSMLRMAAESKIDAEAGGTASSGSVGRGRVAAAARGQVLSLSPAAAGFDTEAYAAVEKTGFVRASDSPLSTFSIDVDTASYSNVRRFLNQGKLPPSGAVRIEELINYFPFAYADPEGDTPFSVTTEISRAPWNDKHRLLHVGLQGKRMSQKDLPPRRLVFLLDVSGSMESANKLPLLKRSLETLTETLTERDQVAIVVYAGASGLVLPPTSGDRHADILAALDRLSAGGSTNGADGIELAYSVAESMARPESINRVVLATDGDFNVGVTSHGALLSLIESKRKTGVFLSVLGFGMGNYKDATLELLADKGNGNYAYIDSLAEARKVLVAEGGSTLLTLAKDVKLQLEFNPSKVAAYRLIGYDNRRLTAQDFNDDGKDAGELGAGHSVTALYELVPPGAAFDAAAVDALKYQARPQTTAGHGTELCTIKLRYKEPNVERSQLIERVVVGAERRFGETSAGYRFAAAVAVFGMTLSESESRGSASFTLARQLAEGALGADPDGYRREFLSLVDTAAALGR